MGRETVSILMPVYKGDKLEYLTEAIASIFNQTKQPDQIVIVIDGPVEKKLGTYLSQISRSNKFLKILKLDENIGLPLALNEGLKLVDSDWIARFDADDIMDPKRIETQMNFVEGKNFDLVGGQIREFDEQNNILERLVPFEKNSIKKMLPWRNPFNHVTVMYRTNLINTFKYRNIPGYEDYDLWFRVINNPTINICNIDSILVHVRAGNLMYRRRSGISYAMRELYFRLMSAKFSHNLFIHWCAGFSRALISLLPSVSKSTLYKWFLRTGVKN